MRKHIKKEGLTHGERRAVMLKAAVDTHQPYKLFRSPIRADGWVLVYQNPRNHERELVMGGIEDKQTGKDLKELLEQSWARGYTVSRED